MQNLLFYYETETSTRPSGLIFLEGSYCERLIAPTSCLGSPSLSNNQSKAIKEEKLQVSNYRNLFHSPNYRNLIFYSIVSQFHIVEKINGNTI